MSKKRLLISGYRSYELRIFKNKDPRVDLIKKLLKLRIIEKVENGCQWILVGGALGVEQWAGEVAIELKELYPELKLALILPFLEFEQRWKPENQEILIFLKEKADFVESVSKKPYFSPQQLKNHTQFLLEHTDEALLVYDSEYPGKTQYLLEEIARLKKNQPYIETAITMTDLEDAQNSFDY